MFQVGKRTSSPSLAPTMDEEWNTVRVPDSRFDDGIKVAYTQDAYAVKAQMMRKLILVRHAAPKIEPGIEAARWRLSAEGRRRCRPLAWQLAAHEPDVIISSLEPKAMETGKILAGLLGVPFETAEGFYEQDRQGVGFLESREAFRRGVTSVFEQPDKLVFGNETGDQAHERFAQAVARVVGQYPDGNAAIVSHGTVISLYVARAAGIDPVPFWRGLGMPAFVVMSLPELLIDVIENIADG